MHQSFNRNKFDVVSQAFEDEDKKIVTHMRDIVQILRLYCTFAVNKAYPEAPPVPVQVTQATNVKFGDYQCNVAPRLAGVRFDFRLR